jgi:hypothetical protein
MTEAVRRVSHEPDPTRRSIVLALPAVALSGAVQASPVDKIEQPLGSGWYDSEHIKRFYQLARF